MAITNIDDITVSLYLSLIHIYYNTVTGYTPMELDSGKQPNRLWDGDIKVINTSNLPAPMEIKRVQADEPAEIPEYSIQVNIQ